MIHYGTQRRGVLAWGVVRLMGGGSGLTSPLGSAFSQCTVRYRPSSTVRAGNIPGGTAARTSSRDRYDNSVHNLVQID